MNRLEGLTRDGESPVAEGRHDPTGILSTTGHVKPCGKQGGPPSKAKDLEQPIVDQYHEGKVKSTPQGG